MKTMKYKFLHPIQGFFLMVLCFTFFSLHSIEMFGVIGRVSLAIAVAGISILTVLYLYLAKSIPKIVLYLLLVVLFVVFIYAASCFYSPDPIKAAYRAFQFSLTVVVLLGAYLYGKTSSKGTVVSWLPALSVASMVAIIFLNGSLQLSAAFQNPNALGMSGFILLALGVFGGRGRLSGWVIAFLALVLIFLSGSRASLLAALISLITYCLLPILRTSSSVYASYLIALLAFGFWSVCFVTGLVAEDLMRLADDLSREYLNKRIESGRNLVWEHVLELVVEKPFLGWGGGIDLSDVSEWEYSVHNLFLQVLFQTGLVGLFGVLLMIMLIWIGLFKASETSYGRASASSFIGLLVLQFFEISLFQNNLALSFPIIVLVGFSMGYRERLFKRSDPLIV